MKSRPLNGTRSAERGSGSAYGRSRAPAAKGSIACSDSAWLPSRNEVTVDSLFATRRVIVCVQ